jgi:hypothetical protein
MKHARLAMLVLGLLTLVAMPQHCFSDDQQSPPCTGKYKGKKPTDAELKEILLLHSAWLTEYGGHPDSRDQKVVNDPRRANLCNAELRDADLTGVHLNDADLTGAELGWIHLNNAKLKGADLRSADLIGVRLTNADLTGANLGNAYLAHASLEAASLNNANLDHADLAMADLAKTYLDFDSDTLPKISPGIASAQNLESVTFQDEPAALVKLRKEFKDLGLRTQENQINYAIRQKLNQSTVSTVLFDWTCQYGMSPLRSLSIVVTIALIMPLVYMFAQISPGRNGGIWAVWDEHSTRLDDRKKEPQQLTDGFPEGKFDCSLACGFVLLAFYFSLLSATRIGWRELNVGTWITRLQPREYSLRATGWVRVVSGIQSLISVYLVALTILTYFGTPFEY